MDSYKNVPMARPTPSYLRELAVNLDAVHQRQKFGVDVALDDLCKVIAGADELRLPPGAVIVARRLLKESAERGNERAAALLKEADDARAAHRLRASLGAPIG